MKFGLELDKDGFIPSYALNNAMEILKTQHQYPERYRELATLIYDSWMKLPEEPLSSTGSSRKILDQKDQDKLHDAVFLNKKPLERAIQHIQETIQKPFKKIKTDEKRIETSFHENETYLYEQVYDGSSQFARYNKQTAHIDYVPSIPTDEGSIVPNIGEELEKHAVLLPSKAEPYESEDQLDQEIKTFIHTWLDVPVDMEQFALWNIKRSWIYDRFHTLNYLRALGDTGQGKSRFLDTLGHLHYKNIFTSGATTSAPVFRIIDKWRGTMTFDEADLKITDETQDIIKIINQGYEKGRHVMRCDQNDATKVLFFDPFCPKILATRKPFADKAVESRCITQVMVGTKRKDISFTLTPEFFQDAQRIRNKLLTWRFHNYDKIDIAKKWDVDFTEFEPRVQQIVTSYISMFGSNPEQMDKFKAFIKQYQADLIEERANSFEGQVVKSIFELFHDQGNLDISAYDIIKQGEMTDHRGEQLKPRSLTNVLKELGFGKTTVRKVEGKAKRCIPLEPEHLDTVFKRYGYVVTKVTIVTGTGDTQDDTLKDDMVTITPPPHIDRNHRNSVTLLLPCSKCAAPPPCHYEDSKTGRPLCEACSQPIMEDLT